MAHYKYYIDGREVFPLNAGSEQLSFDKKDESGLIFQKTVSNEYVFRYSEPNFNFKQEEITGKCAAHTFEITQDCRPEKTLFEGIFTILEGSFDDVNCLYSIKPGLREYLLDDIRINILAETHPVTVLISGYNYTNGRSLANVLLFLAKKSNPNVNGIVSNFFQINPDGAFYLPGVTNLWDNLVMYSLSEMQIPPDTSPAAIENISFKQLLDDLFALFEVHWFIDDNYNVRIEHTKYFPGNIGLNLTDARYDKSLLGSAKYKYDLTNYYKKESWTAIDSQFKASLVYSGLSDINKNTDKNEQAYTTSVLRTDLLYATDNPSATDGIVLMALDGSGAILDDALNPGVLVQNLHTYNRPDFYALYTNQNKDNTSISSGGIILKSIIASKIQENITVPFCCDDIFDANDEIITPLGTAIVDKAKLDLATKTLTMDLRYKIPNCDYIDPSGLSGLDLWLKAGDWVAGVPVVGGNASIMQWNDSSGHGRHATQSDPTKYPFGQGIGTVNGFVQFFANTDPITGLQAEQDSLSTPAFELFPNHRGTIFILGGNDLSNNISILSTQNGGAGNHFDFGQHNDVAIDTWYTNAEGKVYPTYYRPKGLTVLRRASDLAVDVIYSNVVPVNNPLILTYPTALYTINPVILGTNLNVFNPMSGVAEITELIIYNRELTDNEIDQVSLYLVRKGTYGIFN